MFQPIDREELIFDSRQFQQDSILRLRYPPATVKILIVADGSITYGNSGSGFTLKKVLEILRNSDHQDFPTYAAFDITTAHRSGNLSADKPNFTFTANSLKDFDELWLFGINGGVASAVPGQPGKIEYKTYLSTSELKVIGDFMNSGGGVLAMGDHEDLGLGLCSDIPRVRNMRKWWFRGEIPTGQDKAPHVSTLDRNDTVQLVGGSDPGSGGQRDVKPQPIRFKPYYKSRLSLTPTYGHFHWRRYSKYPHPVLCGPLGAITVFPDHAHEGDCVLPKDYGLNIKTTSGNKAEYPGGIKPEVIATGFNVVGRTKSGNTITNPRPFGLLGAYDGHDVNNATIGRVLVDATWHHWFDVNLLGIEDGASQQDGSDDSENWRQIQGFFRNCAVWLAPKAKQRRMRLSGQLITFQAYPILEDYYTWKLEAATKPTASLYHLIGKYSLDALERVTGRCGRLVWLHDFLRLPELVRVHKFDPDIIKPMRPFPTPDSGSKFDIDEWLTKHESQMLASELAEETLATTLFGAAMLEVWKEMEALENNKKYAKVGGEERLDYLQKSCDAAVKKAVKKALPMAMELVDQYQDAADRRCKLSRSAFKKLAAR